MKKSKNRKALVISLLILFLIGLFGFLVFYIKTNYSVKNVYVEGSTHYSEEEIKNFVLDGKFFDNSLYLSHKYKNKEITNIPFIETMDIKVVSRDTIRVIVYEKTLAGYIEFLGQYIYFDKDGVVSEVSHIKTYGIPEVLGVSFDYVVLNEKLPADDPELFSKVLDLTLLMKKYDITAEKIYFTKTGETVLYVGNITVNLGNDENIDIKIMNLPSLLSKLDGMKGVLRMEKYSETNDKVSFEPSGE